MSGISKVRDLEKVGSASKSTPWCWKILEVGQRPKVRIMTNVYIVLNSIRPAAEGEELVAEEISLILGLHYLLSFYAGATTSCSRPETVLQAKGRIRKLGADTHLSLIDLVVDNHFVELEKFGDRWKSGRRGGGQPHPNLRMCIGSRVT